MAAVIIVLCALVIVGAGAVGIVKSRKSDQPGDDTWVLGVILIVFALTVAAIPFLPD